MVLEKKKSTAGRSFVLPLAWLAVCLCTGGCGGKPVFNSLLSGADKASAAEQMSSQSPEETCVLVLPGMDDVSVANVSYKDDLSADIYYPPGYLENETASALPFMLMANSFPREQTIAWFGITAKDFAGSIDFCQLYAASGLAAVAYDVDSPGDDVYDLLKYLRRHHEALRLDSSRIGVHSLSGHGRLALRLITETKASFAQGIKAAVFLHSDMRTPRELREDIPLFVVYTRDQSMSFNSLSEVFVRRAEAKGVPITVIDDASAKNFQFEDPSERSKEILRDTIRFLKSHLLL